MTHRHRNALPWVLALAVLAAASDPVAALGQNVTCTRTVALAPAGANGSTTTCYRFSVPGGSTVLKVQLTPTSGTVDLYVRKGMTSSLSPSDKVTALAATGQAVYALGMPAASTYTMAVVPTTVRSAFAIRAATLADRTVVCAGGGCTYTLGKDLALGANSGDQIIFGVTVGARGQVMAEAKWTGPLTGAVLNLYSAGDTASEPKGVRSGSNPLRVVATAPGAGLWLAVMANSGRRGGAMQSGQVVISAPLAGQLQ